eukprot:CAMPEP_0113487328 /NCGR_PEP_ID=MMETSP0014_2-20120614/25452_1 /TAXON_ID=2857 /ORGANISM="Nitzschia sp." /LENGTH=1050 /DNA_ID=CAMNT_0000381021 /DNA_START=457 /DNA_END=3609 /DNA_ORIENTATION=- /assembly_acc=CAM_ASM_000159
MSASPRLGGEHNILTKEEEDAILQQLVEGDDQEGTSKKTWSRIVAEKYLMKYNWYFPKRDDAPDLKKAWAYYEHVTLPRHFVDTATSGGAGGLGGSANGIGGGSGTKAHFRRAEPGEHLERTELYNPFTTPQKSFIEWGTGVDLYFVSVIFFAALMFVAALMNVAAMLFYASEDYNGGFPKDTVTNALTGTTTKLAGTLGLSAICTNTQWVVCTDCTSDQWDRDPTRFAEGFLDNSSTPTTLVVRNFCTGTQFENAFTNYATLLFAVVGISVISFYLRVRGVRFDEDKVTTTDYSINIKNPPPNAYDPDEWKDFFSQFATDGDQVTCVTITLNNELLMRKIFYYRNFRGQLLRRIPDDTDIDDVETTEQVIKAYMVSGKSSYIIEKGWVGWIIKKLVAPPMNIFGMMLPSDKLYERMKVLKEEIKVLQEKDYTASQVFVTFETEEGQRTALAALKVGLLDLYRQNKHAVSSECLFRGEILLNVIQPAEPNAVRWLDLDQSPIRIFIMSTVTLIATLFMIAVAGVCVFYARRDVGPLFSGILITCFNSTIPQAIKLIMMFEPHQSEGGYQRSLYLNITLFRWVLTAIVPQIITPSTSTLSATASDLIPTIRGILVSECWLSPLLRLSDYMTNAKKHILAPRAQNQEEMNLWFQGTMYNLGERYTDLTKIVFVVFFYSALYPFVFVFGFVILFLQYCTDRFSIFRIWGWTPLIGSELAEFSRRYMFTATLVTFAIVSSYVFSQFPYDNICDDLASQTFGDVNGTYTNVNYADGTSIYEGQQNAGKAEVTQTTTVRFCDQNWHNYDGWSFPANARLQGDSGLTWFNENQDRVTTIYGWTAVAIVIGTVIFLFGRGMIDLVMSLFTGVYHPEGESQHIDFSSNDEIFAYVPQLKFGGHPFPYLCCDIDEIDQGLVGWNDAARSYDYYNLLFEVPDDSLRRTTRIDTNTRSVPRIADYNGYRSLVSQYRSSGTKGGQADEEEGTEVVPPGGVTTGKHRTTPLYSIIKHFPTTWQQELHRAAVSKGTFKDFGDTTIATEEMKKQHSDPPRSPKSPK